MTRRRLLIVAGSVLILAALVLTGLNLTAGMRAEAVSRRMVAALREQAAEMSAAGLTPDFELDPAAPMPRVTVDGVALVGILEIPRLGLELAVRADADDLAEAPGIYAGSVYQRDAVIAGMNHDTQFGRLGTLDEGDEVRFTDVDGNVFTYAVAVREALPADARSEMIGGSHALTLFTSTVGGEQRETVRCDLAE